MKPVKAFAILLIPTLLLGSVIAIGFRPAQAVKAQGRSFPIIHTIEPLNMLTGTDVTKGPPRSGSGTSSMSSVMQSSGNWHIETVDSEGDVGIDTSLVLDGFGRPHVSYCGRDFYDCYDLKYAWYDGAEWRIETVDSGGVGEYSSLALDELGRPHISYVAGDPDRDLKYAWHDGADWRIETVDSAGMVGWPTSLALDGAGHPRISYYADTNLKYAWHDGSRWHIETVDSEEDVVGAGSLLTLDGSGRPRISYCKTLPDSKLKYAWHDGNDWHIETVDSEGCLYSSLAVDGSDRPHIGYGSGKYAWHNGGGWHIEAVDDWCSYISLALDSSGKPHISCYDWSSYDLKYGWRDETSWHVEAVDSVYYWDCRDTSMALDSSDLPHISYYDSTNDDLKYAYLVPPPPISLDKQAMPIDGLHNNEVLTYTLTVSGPGLSVQLWDSLPVDVGYITDSITSTVTPPAVYSPTIDAVIWQGVLPTATVQTIQFQVTPDISGTAALSLSQPIVNTAWLTDTENSRSISATVIVNGWHAYLPLIMRQYP